MPALLQLFGLPSLPRISKKGGRSLTKLTDAIDVDKEKPSKCTLILVEGDSAKAFAISGLSVASDRSQYGVFPLKGKVCNVSGMNANKIGSNEELSQLAKVLKLSLENPAANTSLEDLRYSKLMIMADQVWPTPTWWLLLPRCCAQL